MCLYPLITGSYLVVFLTAEIEGWLIWLVKCKNVLLTSPDRAYELLNVIELMFTKRDRVYVLLSVREQFVKLF